MEDYSYLTEWLKNTLERINILSDTDEMITLTITKGSIKEQVSVGFVEVEIPHVLESQTTDEQFVEDWATEIEETLNDGCSLTNYTTLLEDIGDKTLVKEIALEMIKQDVREELKSSDVEDSLNTLYTETDSNNLESFTDILKG